jgi:hypothetical protein
MCSRPTRRSQPVWQRNAIEHPKSHAALKPQQAGQNHGTADLRDLERFEVL